MEYSIILVAPQLGENIGAAARAMKNFGLSDLRIVAPRDGWPNPKAEEMAAGGGDIIANAKIYPHIEEAIADLDEIYATTARSRDMHKDYINCHELRSMQMVGSKVGILFGREKSGLTNEEISYAQKILTINADESYPSLNIAQAVMLVCYELFNHNANTQKINQQQLCSHNDLNFFINSLIEKLDDTKFFKVAEKRDKMVINIRNIFTRNNLSDTELKTLHGVINHISRKE